MNDDVLEVVLSTAAEIGDPAIDACDDFGVDTKLFGKEGLLDSMGLVTLVIAVEQNIEDRFGKSVALADEKALSQSRSPYRTVGTLVEYASEQLDEA